MNKKLKIYLDTSVINFLYYDLAPDYKDATIDLFENFIKNEIYDTYISGFVIDEINATQDLNKKKLLLETIKSYPISLIDIDNIQEIQFVADSYIRNNIIPEKKYLDALHVAVSTVYEIDYLVSWNFRHLANVNKERHVRSVNLQLGFTKDLRITTPLELINYDTENT